MTCVSIGDACNPPRHLWFEMQSNGKPMITWSAPENDENLSGFVVYRKVNDDGEYTVAKLVSHNKYEYKDNKILEYGNWYFYKVVAYYKDVDCYSIPAKALYGNEYFVKIYYSPEGVDENIANNIRIYPNPAKDLLKIKAENISNVTIYNTVGQKVYEQTFDSSEVSINIDGFDAGIYLVNLVADGNEVTRKISILK